MRYELVSALVALAALAAVPLAFEVASAQAVNPTCTFTTAIDNPIDINPRECIDPAPAPRANVPRPNCADSGGQFERAAETSPTFTFTPDTGFEGTATCQTRVGGSISGGFGTPVTMNIQVVQDDPDMDNIHGARDKCPNTPQGTPVRADGCPDNDPDGDGVQGDADHCPDLPAPTKNGCPVDDRDGDGVANGQDRCPDLNGTLTNGCTPADRDGDGIDNGPDRCPDVHATLNNNTDANNNGCPDTVPRDDLRFSSSGRSAQLFPLGNDRGHDLSITGHSGHLPEYGTLDVNTDTGLVDYASAAGYVGEWVLTLQINGADGDDPHTSTITYMIRGPDDPSPADADGDGFPDEADECPTTSRSRGGAVDANTDGCPDNDVDGDRILDGADSCRYLSATAGGGTDTDSNGCPDSDNDGDGVPNDGTDLCPATHATRTASGGMLADSPPDGCPDTDTDGDGVFEAADKCPDMNAFEGGDVDVSPQDGCPDGMLDMCPNERAPIDANGDGCQDPIVRNDTAMTVRNAPVQLDPLANDTVSGGRTLEVIGIGFTPTTAGRITPPATGPGPFTFTPSPDYIGTVTFTFTISDGRLSPDPFSRMVLTVSDTDADGDGVGDLTDRCPDDHALQAADGSAGTHADGSEFADGDSDGCTDAFIQNEEASTTKNVAVQLDPLSNDTGADLAVTAAEFTPDGAGTLSAVPTAAPYTFTFTPAADYVGTATVTFAISDGPVITGLESVTTLAINDTDGDGDGVPDGMDRCPDDHATNNDSGVPGTHADGSEFADGDTDGCTDAFIQDDTAATVRTHPINIDPLGNDTGADLEIISYTLNPPRGAIDRIANSDSLRFHPSGDFTGVITITFTIGDGPNIRNLSSTMTITVNDRDADKDGVLDKQDSCRHTHATNGGNTDTSPMDGCPDIDAVDEEPVAADVDEPVSIVPLANDRGHGIRVAGAEVNPAGAGGLDKTAGTGTFVFTPAAGHEGEVVITFTVRDGRHGTDGVDDAQHEDTSTARIMYGSADGDGDGTPDSADKCPSTPQGAAVNADGCIEPVANADSRTTPKDTAVTITPLTNDEGEEPRSVVQFDDMAGSHGTLSHVDSSTVRYVPNDDTVGTDTFEISVISSTQTLPSSVEVTVTDTDEDGDTVLDLADRCPAVAATTDTDGDGCTDAVIRDDTATTDGNTPVQLDPLANDTGADLEVTAASHVPAGGTLTGVPGKGPFTYTPPADYTGTVTFTFTISDGPGITDLSSELVLAVGDTTTDGDGDGVPDYRDACPDLHGNNNGAADVAPADGCPDNDPDGDMVLNDGTDACPALRGSLPNGCTPADRDGDLVNNDGSDRCPDVHRGDDSTDSDGDGCIDGDHDRDGVVGEADKCPTVNAMGGGWTDADGDGCPDSDADMDGVHAPDDRCPELAARTADGCPTDDRDGDGVPDEADACPTVAGIEPHGCKADDIDGDGRENGLDKCPTVHRHQGGATDVSPANNGCPDATAVDDHVHTIQGRQATFDIFVNDFGVNLRSINTPTIDPSQGNILTSGGLGTGIFVYRPNPSYTGTFTVDIAITGSGTSANISSSGELRITVAAAGSPDGDGDGVVDSADACPGTSGTAGGARDVSPRNGCPDNDVDGDGVPNAADDCPELAGVAPGGCPAGDSDGDGVPDADPDGEGEAKADACPATPLDGAADTDGDGCPDNDTDGDGVLDVQDRCPRTHATADGSTDTAPADGCPDMAAISDEAATTKDVPTGPIDVLANDTGNGLRVVSITPLDEDGAEITPEEFRSEYGRVYVDEFPGTLVYDPAAGYVGTAKVNVSVRGDDVDGIHSAVLVLTVRDPPSLEADDDGDGGSNGDDMCPLTHSTMEDPASGTAVAGAAVTLEPLAGTTGMVVRSASFLPRDAGTLEGVAGTGPGTGPDEHPSEFTFTPRDGHSGPVTVSFVIAGQDAAGGPGHPGTERIERQVIWYPETDADAGGCPDSDNDGDGVRGGPRYEAADDGTDPGTELTTPKNTSLVIMPLANDTPGMVLEPFSLEDGSGTLVSSDDAGGVHALATYTPACNYSGPAEFVISVALPDDSDTLVSTVRITVQDGPDDPACEPPETVHDEESVTSSAGASKDILPFDNDFGPNPSIDEFDPMEGECGTLSRADSQTLRYVPEEDEACEEFFRFMVSIGGEQLQSTLDVSVTRPDADGDGVPDTEDYCPSTPPVEPVSDPVVPPTVNERGCIPPVARDDSERITNSPGASVDIMPLGNDDGEDGSVVSIDKTAGDCGTLALSGDVLTYTPRPNMRCTDEFEVTVSLSGEERTSRLAITVVFPAAVPDSRPLTIGGSGGRGTADFAPLDNDDGAVKSIPQFGDMGGSYGTLRWVDDQRVRYEGNRAGTDVFHITVLLDGVSHSNRIEIRVSVRESAPPDLSDKTFSIDDGVLNPGAAASGTDAAGAALLGAADAGLQDSDAARLDAAGTSLQDAPDTAVQDAPETVLQDAADTTVQDASDTTVQDASDTTVQDASDTTVQDAPDTTVQDAPDTTVQDAPDTTVQDAPGTAQLPAGLVPSSSNEHLEGPTFGTSLLTGELAVGCGYAMDGQCRDVTEYHVEYEREIIETGSTHDFSLKAHGEHDIEWFQIGFGVPEIGSATEEAEAMIHVEVSPDYASDAGYRVDRVEYRNDNNVIGEDATFEAYLDYCAAGDSERDCVTLEIDGVLFREQMYAEPFVIFVMDENRRTATHYMNDGLLVQGDSLNPAPEHTMTERATSQGAAESIMLQRTDKLGDIWEDGAGHVFTRNDSGTWILLEAPAADMSSACTSSESRLCDAFDKKLEWHGRNMAELRDSLYGSVYTAGEFEGLEEAVSIYDLDGDSRTAFLESAGMMWLRGQ